KCVRIRQLLCESPLDATPYTVADIETMLDELLAKYPETDEQRLEWIEKRIRERESQRTSAQPENTIKPERETVSYHQQGYNTPQGYVDAYCKKQAHRRKLSGVEVTRLFRESEGQVCPDEIERIHACEHQNFLWEQKNERWEAVV
ncbi:MAG: hypothetical protein O7E52_25295, partial [Candidatus Poribacteria bacterium]|nr:hypothetical protein [Candidatus Poribacteria bacterium]